MTGPLRTLLAFVLLFGALSPAAPARAQIEPWRCDVPATPAASPEASPSPAMPAPPVAFPAEGGQLTVFAAASLTDAFEQMADDIAAANPGVEITFNFAGSQALVTQLTEGGAEAGVLATANESQMNAAIEGGVPADSPRIFARNLLTIAVPTDNPADIDSIVDLAAGDIRLVLANPDVPAGDYARDSLCLASASILADPQEFVAAVAASIVSEEENVRAVLTKVELGEADAGIVYVTDAMTSGDSVLSFAIPDELNVIAEYPIAALNDDPLSAAFVSYVLSEEGQATLASFGFAAGG